MVMLWISLFAILFSAVTTSAEPFTGLVLWAKLDEASRWTSYDSSGKGNHLTRYDGGGFLFPINGVLNGAYNFTGGDCFRKEAASHDGTGDITIAAWIRPNSIVNSARIVTIGDDNTRLYTATSSVLAFTSNNTTTVASTTTSALTIGFWQHVAAVRPSAGSGVILYVNGVDKTSVNTSGTPVPGTRINLGGFGTGTVCSAVGFDGALDDVRIYNRLLSAAEIKTLAQMRQEPPPVVELLGAALSAGPRRKVTVTVE